MSRAPARLVWLDALRGAALFGIAQVNFPSYVTGSLPAVALLDAHASTSSRVAAALVTGLMTAKVYPLFAALFGYAHALQRRALPARGLDARRYLTARYGWLLVIGVVHGNLFFFGDILTMYALAGLVLLSFDERLTPSVQTGLFAAVTATLSLVTVTQELWVPLLSAQLQHAEVMDGVARLAQGSLGPLALARARLYWITQAAEFGTLLPQLLMFMSAGMWAEQIGLWQAPAHHRILFRRLVAVGVVVGVPINLLFVATSLGLFPAGSIFASAACFDGCSDLAWCLTLAYMGALGLRAARRQDRPGPIVRALAVTGRYALTNYLLQSVCMALAWSAGLATLAPARLYGAAAALALGVCLLQVAGAHWLERRYGRGPAEALWRRLTLQSARARLN